MSLGENQSFLKHRKKSVVISGHDNESVDQKSHKHEHPADATSRFRDESDLFDWRRLWMISDIVIGVIIMLSCGCGHGYYVRTMHENNLWFSNIKEVEREISFRTECGLYYSYYKQLVQSPSLSEGIMSLTHDKLTEHPDSINVLARMNIYQEVFLAVIYRIVPGIQNFLEPVYFYIETVFALHILLVIALYAMAWFMSGTFLAGALAAIFYIFNKSDTTRVESYIPLRESFSLPFLWIQLAAITVYFSKDKSQKLQIISRILILCSTFLFALTWQFNQFALLLQSFSLFAVQLLHLVDHRKILFVYVAQSVSMLVVCLMQFFNPMIPSGLLLSFIASSLVIMWIQKYESLDCSLVWKMLRLFSYIVLVFVLALLFNRSIKFLIQQEADEHINRFVLSKFGFKSSRDFDVRLYLCNGAFEFITFDVFERLSANLVFPFYAVTHLVLLILICFAAFQILRKKSSVAPQPKHLFSDCPELAFHAVQTVFFGAVAVIAIRMKYFWTPYMCVLASVGLSNDRVYHWVLSRWMSPSQTMCNVLRNVAVILVSFALLFKALPGVKTELETLLEFYDPDTVELMEWIKSDTSVNASFTGSMQLLAGVKLCTNRPITNHPHYEDKHLREKTKELYQIYGRRLPEDVHTILRKYSSDYIILEDSICLAPTRDGCRLPDLIDVDSGIIPDFGLEEEGLVLSKVPRFCHQIRHGAKDYSKFFMLVFENKTFRVYRVLHNPL